MFLKAGRLHDMAAGMGAAGIARCCSGNKSSQKAPEFWRDFNLGTALVLLHQGWLLQDGCSRDGCSRDGCSSMAAAGKAAAGMAAAGMAAAGMAAAGIAAAVMAAAGMPAAGSVVADIATAGISAAGVLQQFLRRQFFGCRMQCGSLLGGDMRFVQFYKLYLFCVQSVFLPQPHFPRFWVCF